MNEEECLWATQKTKRNEDKERLWATQKTITVTVRSPVWTWHFLDSYLSLCACGNCLFVAIVCAFEFLIVLRVLDYNNVFWVAQTHFPHSFRRVLGCPDTLSSLLPACFGLPRHTPYFFPSCFGLPRHTYLTSYPRFFGCPLDTLLTSYPRVLGCPDTHSFLCTHFHYSFATHSVLLPLSTCPLAQVTCSHLILKSCPNHS
ncbi:MAG: hypothetical protein QOE33_3724 [Acidobacteriota bacterium]|nr:hypothetical protein [Acidobacteriota bacterium]